MNLQLDPHVKAVFDDIVAHTPDIGPTPSGDVVNLDPGPSHQGRRWLAVAAATIVVVGVGALVAVQRPGSDTPATQSPAPGAEPAASAPGGMMLLDPLPDGLANADVTATAGRDPVLVPAAPDRDWIRRWYTSTMEQPEVHPHLEVSSVSTTQQIDPPNVDDVTAVTVQGTEGWLYDDPFGRGRSVVFHDGRTMFVLTGYELSDDELLLAAENTVLTDVSSFGAVVDSAGLPAGLVERAVGTTFESHFLPLESQQYASPMIRWDAGAISVWMQTITEDLALVSLHRLGYDTVTDTTVRDQPAFVTTIASQPEYVGVTWSENGITYLLGSNGLLSDLAIDYANRLRPATGSEWNDLLAAVPAPDAPDPTIAPTTTVLSEVAQHTPAGTSASPGATPPLIEPNFPSNDAGRTYGDPDPRVAFDDYPDLLQVEATNGKVGYVDRQLLGELTGANVSSPEEAVEWQRQQDAAGVRGILIPVYESDGTTVIGQFPIESSTTTPP